LGPFNRTGYQLRIEHDIEGVNPEVPFCGIIPPVDLDGIAHCLKSMKGQTDRQYDIQQGQGKRSSGRSMKQFINILDKEIIVFEKSEYADIGDYAHDEEQFSPSPAGVFNHDACDVIDDNRKNKNQYIDRNEVHVKNATGYEQVEPSEPMGEKEINQRIKQHGLGLSGVN